MTNQTDATVVESFNARIADTDMCAHAVFPEVSENAAAMHVIDGALSAVVHSYNMAQIAAATGQTDPQTALDAVLDTIGHAMVLVAALGYALGQSHAAGALDGEAPDDLSELGDVIELAQYDRPDGSPEGA